jgi:uncharacterized protein (DUF433 family)
VEISGSDNKCGPSRRKRDRLQTLYVPYFIEIRIFEGICQEGEVNNTLQLHRSWTLGYRGRTVSTEQRARLNEIVSIDPDLMHGVPCFRGTRVPVRLLLDDLKSGATIDEFLAGCPTVSRKVVEGYLELAQDLVNECVGS